MITTFDSFTVDSITKSLTKLASHKPHTPDLTKKTITPSELTEKLKTIGSSLNFIKYANKYGKKNYTVNVFDSYFLTHGFCNPLSYYLMDRFNNLDVFSAKNDTDGNHLFLRFQNLYYDAKNNTGVQSPNQLDFFTTPIQSMKLLESDNIPKIVKEYIKCKSNNTNKEFTDAIEFTLKQSIPE